MTRICVFCGSSAGARDSYREAAVATGSAIAGRGIELIYGGGNIGLMGAIADAVLSAGGKVTGIIPYALLQREVGHLQLTQLHVVDSMHERKAMMAELADGFVAMPGGFGTFEEIFEIITWAQLGMHHKPCAFLNIDGYYDPLLAMVAHAEAEKFILPQYHSLILSGTDPNTLLDEMERYSPPALEHWIDRRSA